jgi:hypothetical protein
MVKPPVPNMRKSLYLFVGLAVAALIALLLMEVALASGATINGHVWNDFGDGEGEATGRHAVAGVELILVDSAGTVVAVVTSDATGAYAFAVDGFGAHVVQATVDGLATQEKIVEVSGEPVTATVDFLFSVDPAAVSPVASITFTDTADLIGSVTFTDTVDTIGSVTFTDFVQPDGSVTWTDVAAPAGQDSAVEDEAASFVTFLPLAMR